MVCIVNWYHFLFTILVLFLICEYCYGKFINYCLLCCLFSTVFTSIIILLFSFSVSLYVYVYVYVYMYMYVYLSVSVYVLVSVYFCLYPYPYPYPYPYLYKYSSPLPLRLYICLCPNICCLCCLIFQHLHLCIFLKILLFINFHVRCFVMFMVIISWLCYVLFDWYNLSCMILFVFN